MGMQAITAGKLNEWVVNQKEFFIFDVRNEKDFEDWKVEGENIQYLNIPYFELIDGVEEVVNQLPKDKDIVVICAKEGSSVMVAEMLSEAAFDVSYLSGGMKSWSEYLYPVEVFKDEQIKVLQFIRVGKGCLSYMVLSENEALVVDPSRFTERYTAVAERENVKITHIVDSHLHADHLSGGKQLAELTGAKYYLMKSEGAVFDFEALEQHDKIEFDHISLEVLALKTPGHTPGSVSFFVNNKLLFSGDTIFVNGLGRPDLGGKAAEWAEDLYETVYSKVSQIADDVIVLPGHYADFDGEVNADCFIGSQLGLIRNQNEMMEGKTIEEFVDHVAQSASSDTPPNFEDIVAINRGVKEVTADEAMELEIGPNRCAVHHTH
ncbi:MBL fold metallo-hydrolase [Bacillus sp. JJ1609]|uniref:MBL fold metallo-hydrolase n=1 Tax=Bacillus sp. JJ1609 TaxID=3122977 RepID=UPI003000F828